MVDEWRVPGYAEVADAGLAALTRLMELVLTRTAAAS
jgi:hypothetical protein